MARHPSHRASVAAAGAAAVSSAAVAALLVSGNAAAAPPMSRTLVAPVIKVIKLVSDQPGVARLRDPQLVNAWGMSHGPDQPLWVSDNGADVSTIYTGGTPSAPVQKAGLTVSVPGGAPTGQVYNPTSGFTLPGSFPAHFIFAGEDGDLTGWYAGTSAVTVAQNPAAVYKGLALDPRHGGPLLLVADFHTGAVDVFDSSFQPTVLGGSAFTDPNLPAKYAPFNIAIFGRRVYVSYAKQDAAAHDDSPGAGHGFVDVYGLGGAFVKRLVTRGALNSPWGMALAPKTFGKFAGALLVGNFGDGTIHAYNRSTGQLLGGLRTASGRLVRIDGLWGLTPGDKAAGGVGSLWFSAGPASESHGLLGLLRVGVRTK